jgi:hypothetical protein
MTHAEMKKFIRNHFEEFVNRKNLGIGEVNFAPDFVDHGADVQAAAGILWHRDLEDCQPADFGALGVPGESSPSAQLGLEEHR